MTQQNSYRGIIILGGFAFILLLYIIRLLYLQVLNSEYAIKANAVDIDRVAIYPSRGIIYDRAERLYVINSPIFDVEFIPNKITIPTAYPLAPASLCCLYSTLCFIVYKHSLPWIHRRG